MVVLLPTVKSTHRKAGGYSKNYTYRYAQCLPAIKSLMHKRVAVPGSALAFLRQVAFEVKKSKMFCFIVKATLSSPVQLQLLHTYHALQDMAHFCCALLRSGRKKLATSFQASDREQEKYVLYLTGHVICFMHHCSKTYFCRLIFALQIRI